MSKYNFETFKNAVQENNFALIEEMETQEDELEYIISFLGHNNYELFQIALRNNNAEMVKHLFSILDSISNHRMIKKILISDDIGWFRNLNGERQDIYFYIIDRLYKIDDIRARDIISFNNFALMSFMMHDVEHFQGIFNMLLDDEKQNMICADFYHIYRLAIKNSLENIIDFLEQNADRDNLDKMMDIKNIPIIRTEEEINQQQRVLAVKESSRYCSII